jgi:hypothetical protein
MEIKCARYDVIQDPETGLEVTIGHSPAPLDYLAIALVHLLTTPSAEFDLPQEIPSKDLRPAPTLGDVVRGTIYHDRWVYSGFLSTPLPGFGE